MKFIAKLRVWGNWGIGENVLKVFLRLRGSANRRVDLFLPLIASILCPRRGARGDRRWPVEVAASGGWRVASSEWRGHSGQESVATECECRGRSRRSPCSPALRPPPSALRPPPSALRPPPSALRPPP